MESLSSSTRDQSSILSFGVACVEFLHALCDCVVFLLGGLVFASHPKDVFVGGLISNCEIGPSVVDEWETLVDSLRMSRK